MVPPQEPDKHPDDMQVADYQGNFLSSSTLPPPFLYYLLPIPFYIYHQSGQISLRDKPSAPVASVTYNMPEILVYYNEGR